MMQTKKTILGLVAAVATSSLLSSGLTHAGTFPQGLRKSALPASQAHRQATSRRSGTPELASKCVETFDKLLAEHPEVKGTTGCPDGTKSCEQMREDCAGVIGQAAAEPSPEAKRKWSQAWTSCGVARGQTTEELKEAIAKYERYRDEAIALDPKIKISEQERIRKCDEELSGKLSSYQTEDKRRVDARKEQDEKRRREAFGRPMPVAGPLNSAKLVSQLEAMTMKALGKGTRKIKIVVTSEGWNEETDPVTRRILSRTAGAVVLTKDQDGKCWFDENGLFRQKYVGGGYQSPGEWAVTSGNPHEYDCAKAFR